MVSIARERARGAGAVRERARGGSEREHCERAPDAVESAGGFGEREIRVVYIYACFCVCEYLGGGLEVAPARPGPIVQRLWR